MSRFLPLHITDIRRDTRDAVVVTLRPRPEDAGTFDFTQGQYLTFRRDFDGEELRRSYSICAGKDEGFLQVGIKRVDGGAFSTWANENLSPGDEIDAMPPMGKFFTPITPEAEKQYLGFAGGSGITPVLSIIKTVLSQEPRSKFTLVYSNRQINSIMFREDLEDLKNLYLGRFSVIHILEQEGQEIDLFTGRIDGDKMKGLFTHWLDASAVDTAFICGPEPMMLAIAQSLRDHGLTDAQMLTLIQAIHVEFKGAYGSPRMIRELRLRRLPASKERVVRLMQENGIKAKHKRRFKVTTDSKHNLPIAPNLLNRNLTPDALNQVWTSGTPTC